MRNSKLATLITCHNRRQKTLNCLRALYQSVLPVGYCMDLFLVDDGSTDGTGNAVKKEFPQVHIIQGSGQLYWNRGMHLAWQTAAQHQKYDFYLWLNDDTILDQHALNELLDCSNEALEKGNLSIITGSCRRSKDDETFTYGGRTEKRHVIPNGNLQACTYINGNAVLIPHLIFTKLGNLAPEYTHTMGDFDYGLRALQAGFSLFSTRCFIATCPQNDKPAWCDPEVPLKKRWKSFHSPNGLNIKEYNTFRKKFCGSKWLIFTIKAYFKVLFPSIKKYKYINL
jgi:GT2 family glycosyltransferase